MFTDYLIKLVTQYFSPHIEFSPKIAPLIEKYLQEEKIPRRDAQIAELKLVVAYAIMLVIIALIFTILAAILVQWRNGIVNFYTACMFFLFCGLILHLFRYYKCLFIFYRDKHKLENGKGDTTIISGTKMLSSDWDFLLQFVIAVVVLAAALLENK